MSIFSPTVKNENLLKDVNGSEKIKKPNYFVHTCTYICVCISLFIFKLIFIRLILG